MLAAFVNGTFSQTISITFGIANCNAGDAVKAQLDYMAANYRNLSRELAAGQGEYLSTLESMLGCSPEAAGSFGKAAQSKYASIISSRDTTPAQALAGLKRELGGDAALTSGCPGLAIH